MSLDQSTEYKVYQLSHKESFGCLKAIQMFVTNDLETPLFDRGRQDRSPVVNDYVDTTVAVNLIRVRVFYERKMYNITGV